MDDQERSLLALLAVLLAAKLLQQVVLLLRPVRVGVISRGKSVADAVTSARDAADFALYAKGGKPPGWSRLRLTLCLSAAAVACVPPWWRLTSVRVCTLSYAVLSRRSEAARRYIAPRCRWTGWKQW